MDSKTAKESMCKDIIISIQVEKDGKIHSAHANIPLEKQNIEYIQTIASALADSSVRTIKKMLLTSKRRAAIAK